ncbi:hypothetical protein GCM10018781_72480 [Kitasatospora indigofera]|uniref:Uncharacterized protein n=1 Tax=Kitasatospora indigofera TaxID=67307 RepID=A0A919L4Y7_9ACTN|nr:hypothetical protein [Kitasatospora indigofera]GHH84012.1 hypothetical protein GCM10018781_72480 [Kitasatospora indigofera]
MPNKMVQWGEEFFWRRGVELRSGLVPDNDMGTSVVQRGFEPCLLAVIRLSMSSSTDSRTTSGWFRETLARTGHLPRAVELASAISDGLQQGEELYALVNAAADAGDLHSAQALAESIPLRGAQDRAMVDLVAAWARAGDRDRAAALAEQIRYPHNWGAAWAGLAKAVLARGDTVGARGFAARADDEVRSYVFDGTGEVLAVLVEVAAATGDRAWAAALADRVEDFARSRHRNTGSRPPALAAVLAWEAQNGDLDRIDALLRPSPRPPAADGPALCGWVPGASAALDGPRTGTSPEEPDDLGGTGGEEAEQARVPAAGPFLRARDMARLLDALAGTTDHDVALALADRAERLLDTGLASDRALLVTSVSRLLARLGQVERAMAVVGPVDPRHRAAQQAMIVEQLARHGCTDRAEALARAIADDETRARALITLVRELARRGDPDRAEGLVHVITDEWARGEARVAVVRELARRGDRERAEALTRSVVHRATRARALAGLAELSEPSRARRLAAQVVLLDGWTAALPVLERIAPRAVAVVADQLTL